MRAIIQRVLSSSVKVNNQIIGEITKGLMILLAVEESDTHDDIVWLGNKIAQMRIFGDDQGKMNLSLKDISGSALIVSQFTLFASTKKGNRPSFIKSAKPEFANDMYQEFVKFLSVEHDIPTQTGQFAADMKVELINDGPVTIILDSKNKE